MSRASARTGPGLLAALAAGLRHALQWRLLFWWWLATLVPVLIASLPLFARLQSRLGHSLLDWSAAQPDLPLLSEALFGRNPDALVPLGINVGIAGVLVLLASPWLAAMGVAAARSERRLGLTELARAGVEGYGRMLRMLLWSAIPLGFAIGAAAAAMGAAKKATEHAILASDVERATLPALLLGLVVFVVLHASVEAGRGQLGAFPERRSAVRAWWRGLRLLVRRPLAVLGAHVSTLLIGGLLLLLLTAMRLRLGADAWLIGLVVAQLGVLALGWTRFARLHAMTAYAAASPVATGPTDAIAGTAYAGPPASATGTPRATT